MGCDDNFTNKFYFKTINSTNNISRFTNGSDVISISSKSTIRQFNLSKSSHRSKINSIVPVSCVSPKSSSPYSPRPSYSEIIKSKTKIQNSLIRKHKSISYKVFLIIL